jgi:hypothetical protein
MSSRFSTVVVGVYCAVDPKTSMPMCPGCNCHVPHDELRDHIRSCEHLQTGAPERRETQDALLQSTMRTGEKSTREIVASQEQRIKDLEDKIQEIETKLNRL